MTTENFTDELDTPTEADLDSCYGSKFLSARDVGNRRIRTKIAKVRKQALKQQSGGTRNRFILSFTTLDKELVLNTTNKDALVDALGRRPADWIDAEVGIFTVPTTYGPGTRLRVLNKPVTVLAAKPTPTPLPATLAEPPWPDQQGDPGPGFTEVTA
jgi:hypothetical protein